MPPSQPRPSHAFTRTCLSRQPPHVYNVLAALVHTRVPSTFKFKPQPSFTPCRCPSDCLPLFGHHVILLSSQEVMSSHIQLQSPSGSIIQSSSCQAVSIVFQHAYPQI